MDYILHIFKYSRLVLSNENKVLPFYQLQKTKKEATLINLTAQSIPTLFSHVINRVRYFICWFSTYKWLKSLM